MLDYKFLEKIENSRKKIINKDRLCLIPDCKEVAINSHVFQKKTILKQIARPDNHFYSLKLQSSVYSLIKNPIFKLVKVGINEGYSFPGFCKNHDDGIFAPIEKNSIDFFSNTVQSLFTYRTLCLELRKKEIVNDLLIDRAKIIFESKKDNWLFDYLCMDQQIIDCKQAIKDLLFFKTQLEDEIFNLSQSKYNYSTLKLPYLDICFSTPLNIFDKNNVNSNEIDEFGFDKKTPITTSVLNFFTFDNNSYLITATHKEYFCNWTSELIIDLQNPNIQFTKIISDILTFRCEFFAISQTLFNQLDRKKILDFEKITHDNFDNYNYKVNSKFNLFEDIICNVNHNK